MPITRAEEKMSGIIAQPAGLLLLGPRPIAVQL
jgi:hypothetical protein